MCLKRAGELGPNPRLLQAEDYKLEYGRSVHDQRSLGEDQLRPHWTYLLEAVNDLSDN